MALKMKLLPAILIYYSAVCFAGGAGLNPKITAKIYSGINYLYNLDFDAAEKIFTETADAASNHPIGCVYLGMTSIGRTLTEGETSANTARFHAYTETAVARALSSRSAIKRPWDLYYSGAAFLLKSYSEGKKQNYIESLKWLKRGVALINRCEQMEATLKQKLKFCSLSLILGMNKRARLMN